MEQVECDSAAQAILEDATKAMLELCTALVSDNGYQLNDIVDPVFLQLVSALLDKGNPSVPRGLIVPVGANGRIARAAELIVRAYGVLTHNASNTAMEERAKQPSTIALANAAVTAPAPTSKNAAEKIETPTGKMLACRLVMEAIRREAHARGKDASLISEIIEVITSFLHLHGYSLDSSIPVAFGDKVGTALKSAAPNSNLRLPSGTDPTTCLEKIATFVLAFRALAEADFGSAVIRRLKVNPHLTYQDICVRCGLPPLTLKTWVAERPRFTTTVTAELARKLDEILHADGELLFSFIATTQHAAYGAPPSIMDQVLGRNSFGQKLRKYRRNLMLTKAQLLAEVEQRSGVRVSKYTITCWELGSCLPHRGMQVVIAALDEICGAGGDLVKAWRAENPRELYSAYSLQPDQWLQSVRAQIKRIISYKTANPENLPRSNSRDDRWKDETIEYFTDFCSCFLGFLRKERQFELDGLSLSLLCDWDLIQEFFDFLRSRTAKINHSLRAKTVTRTLLNLYNNFMPEIWAEAVKEAHWIDRITLQGTRIVRVADMVERRETVVLGGLDESWRHHLALTINSANDFLRQNQFDDHPRVGNASALVEAGFGVARIFAELEERAKNLPLLILCRKSAILLRRLALVALLLARNFRPATLRRLRCSQFTLASGRRITFAISDRQLGLRKRDGNLDASIDELPNIAWLHELVWRYIVEARPLLLNQLAPGAGSDTGYLFISSTSHCAPGDPLSQTELAADVKRILGYGPYSHRLAYLYDAYTKETSVDDMAFSTQTTPAMVRRTIDRLAAIKTLRANSAVDAVLAGNPRHRRKQGGFGAP